MPSQTGESDCRNGFVRGPITALAVSVSPRRSDISRRRRRRRGLNVAYVQHFTEKFEPGLKALNVNVNVMYASMWKWGHGDGYRRNRGGRTFADGEQQVGVAGVELELVDGVPVTYIVLERPQQGG